MLHIWYISCRRLVIVSSRPCTYDRYYTSSMHSPLHLPNVNDDKTNTAKALHKFHNLPQSWCVPEVKLMHVHQLSPMTYCLICFIDLAIVVGIDMFYWLVLRSYCTFVWFLPVYLLINCGLVATQIWVNIDSGNGLVSDGTKPLREPMLTSHWRDSEALTWEQFYN